METVTAKISNYQLLLLLHTSITELSVLLRNECLGGAAFVLSSHSFWTSNSLDVPAGVTQQEEGHTGFLIHLLSAVRALIFLTRRVQPFLSPSSTVKSNFVH